MAHLHGPVERTDLRPAKLLLTGLHVVVSLLLLIPNRIGDSLHGKLLRISIAGSDAAGVGCKPLIAGISSRSGAGRFVHIIELKTGEK